VNARLARNGDVEGFRAYVCGDEFLVALNGLDPEHGNALCAPPRAEALCEAKAAPALGQAQTHRRQASLRRSAGAIP
jgi:hypothetical protein